ncbi:MAG: 6-carboxytetrahydropterin synthase [Candidatus Jordarchaeales archaeon]|nr:6-carboxytetrahydropterin synthase [Candidatus Jordarchaeia archaeon]
MPYKITIERADLVFSAAHFLLSHEKCARLHGHNYKVRVEASSPLLNLEQMVVDFFTIRSAVKSVCEPLDHRVLVPTKSQGLKLKEDEGEICIMLSDRRYVFPRNDVALLPIEATTAEKIAEYIHHQLKRLLPTNLHLKVSVEEAEGATATFEE